MSDWDLPSPQYNPNYKPEEVDKINIDKLSLDPDNPQEEPLQVTDSLIPSPTREEKEKTTTQERQMLGQTKTSKRKKNVRNDRKSMSDNSAMRKATLVQTFKASVITTNMDLFRV